jgi:putative membrane protein
MRTPAGGATRLEKGAWYVLLVFTMSAIVGYGWFGLNPGRLPATGFALRLYNVSFQFFAQAQILIALAVLSVPLVRRTGWRWLAPFGVVYGISFLSEHIGTGYGIPFGGYEYTGLLGARVGPRVPMLIPISWFLMALPAWVMTRAALGPEARRLLVVPMGALWLVVWDLALDPAMSFLTPYWRWADTGPYYGMPWMNLVGWFATGLLLLTVLDLVAGWARLDRLPPRWVVAYYGAMLLMPLGMLAAAGAWTAVLTTGVAAACYGLILRLPARARAAAPETGSVPAGESVAA